MVCTMFATPSPSGRSVGMTPHSLAAIQDILRLEPAHDPVRQELERIVARARLHEADTELPGAPITRRDVRHDGCRGPRVVFEL